jgi:hypothetical protein
MKKEHVVFLERALIPLHRAKVMGMYHQQLSYCVSQYAEKDPSTAVPIVLGLVKAWPWSSSAKQGAPARRPATAAHCSRGSVDTPPPVLPRRRRRSVVFE